MSKRTKDYVGCVCPTPHGECEPDVVVPEDELDIVVPEDELDIVVPDDDDPVGEDEPGNNIG